MIGISGFGYGLSVAVVSFLLIWGLRVIGRELQKPADPSKVGGVTVMREVISDKEKVLKDVEPATRRFKRGRG